MGAAELLRDKIHLRADIEQMDEIVSKSKLRKNVAIVSGSA